MRYYKLIITPHETILGPIKNNSHCLPSEDMCQLNDEEKIEDYIEKNYLPEEVDNIRTEFEVKYQESSAEEYLKYREEMLLHRIQINYHWEKYGNLPIREYMHMKKSQTDTEKIIDKIEAIEKAYRKMRSAELLIKNKLEEKLTASEFINSVDKMSTAESNDEFEQILNELKNK